MELIQQMELWKGIFLLVWKQQQHNMDLFMI